MDAHASLLLLNVATSKLAGLKKASAEIPIEIF